MTTDARVPDLPEISHDHPDVTGGWLRRVDKLRIPGVVRIGRLLVIWGRFLRGLALSAAGRLVIFDRYIYDAEVPTPYHLGPAARLARWIDGHACPGPDVTILLDAPGEVMFQRKGEYDGATLEHWRQRFLGVRRRVPDLVRLSRRRILPLVLGKTRPGSAQALAVILSSSYLARCALRTSAVRGPMWILREPGENASSRPVMRSSKRAPTQTMTSQSCITLLAS